MGRRQDGAHGVLHRNPVGQHVLPKQRSRSTAVSSMHHGAVVVTGDDVLAREHGTRPGHAPVMAEVSTCAPW